MTPTPQMPMSSALPSLISRSRYIAWCARWKPPTPKCTMPVVTWLRSYVGPGTSSDPTVAAESLTGVLVAALT